MELNNLKYFKRTAELNSVTKTAKEFGVVQSNVSHHIKALEEEFGTVFFDRRKNSLTLNKHGKILYAYASRILDLIEDSKKEIYDKNNNTSNTLTISIDTIPIIFPYIIRGFKEEYPGIKINLIQYQNQNIYDMDRLNCDLLIYASDEEVKKIPNSLSLYEEGILLCVSKKHRFAKRGAVDIGELEGEKFIQYSDESALRKLTNKYLGKAGFNLTPTMYTDYPPFIIELISFDMGIAFLPQLTWKYFNNPNTSLVPIRNLKMFRHINIAWHSNRYISSSTLLFIDYIKNFFSKLRMGE